jgi:hypothetical protein
MAQHLTVDLSLSIVNIIFLTFPRGTEMKRFLLALSMLLCSVAANAQSPDGSIVLPPNINQIGPLGSVANGVSPSFGIATLTPQTSPSGDYQALVKALVTPAQAAVATPPGPWTLIFDSEFNGTGDYTTLDPVWGPASGNNLRGGNYCWAEHNIMLNNHEIDFAAKSPCRVSGATQSGEGARIATGPQTAGATFDCSPAGVISISGVTQKGFCFSPTNTRQSNTPPEIYEETLYDVPCSSGNLLDHAAFWNVGNGQWPTTNEFDIIQPLNKTQLAAEMFYGAPSSPQVTFGTPAAACGWHVFGAHWIGGSTPSIEFLVDGASAGIITQNVTTAPAIALLELGWAGTPATTTAPATAKAVYVHIFGKGVTYPAVEPQTNYGGPGDTAGKVLGAQ